MNKITERTTKKINKDRRQFLEKVGSWGVSGSLLRASPVVAAMLQSRMVQAQDDRKLILIYQMEQPTLSLVTIVSLKK